jgi:dihydropyrimidinase
MTRPSADLIIRSGTIVTAEGTTTGDVAVRDGTIVAVDDRLGAVDGDVLDAGGKLVLPGGVDPHVHLEAGTQGQRTADDFFTGTRAAALGGTTTVIDFCYQPVEGTLVDGLRPRLDAAAARAVVDFGFHLVVTRLDADNVHELAAVCAAGVTSFKVYTAYAKRGLLADDGTLLRLFDRCAGLGALPVVHAENGLVNDVLVEEARSAGRLGPEQHPLTHPEASEAEATHRSLVIAALAGAPIYFVHVSCVAALDEIVAARRAGRTAFAETCPHYLLLDDSLYGLPEPEAAKFVMNPPLRDARNQERLWAALADGEIDTIATDHSPFNLGQKAAGRGDFSKIPNGVPGVEHRLTLLFEEGVRAGGLSLERWVDAFATRPAALFGLERKGRIAVGCDADIVLFDPEHESVITHHEHHMNVDYDAYEGRRIHGSPRTVLSRGEVIVRDGTFVGESGRGLFQRRTCGGPR